jgi:arsenical pump membrane protein
LVTLHGVFSVVLAAATVAGIIIRPWRIPEWVWAVAGAAAALLFGLLLPAAAGAALARGWNVYLFLAGIMLLAELARQHGVFDTLSDIALRAAGGSQGRLFTLFFGTGVIVTAFLANDTTAVLLTVAVCAAIACTSADPLPYVYACAFVSNATSFILPISNPANLVVFDDHLPLLGAWIQSFGLSALVAIAATYIILWYIFRGALSERYVVVGGNVPLSPAGRIAAVALVLSAIALIVTNACGGSIGIAAASAAIVAIIFVSFADSRTLIEATRHVAWGIIPLVGGLFVVVAALDSGGLLGQAASALHEMRTWEPHTAALVISGVIAIAANIFNNLPVALFARSTLQAHVLPHYLSHVVLVAVDLGPNLSVSGSLSTLLWLTIVRRANLHVTPWHFFRLGLVVCLPALLLATLCVR